MALGREMGLRPGDKEERGLYPPEFFTLSFLDLQASSFLPDSKVSPTSFLLPSLCQSIPFAFCILLMTNTSLMPLCRQL